MFARYIIAKNKGGRQPKYDWHRAIAHLVALANTPNGLDPTGTGRETNVSYVAELMERWFDTQGMEIPGSSQLRRFAGMAVAAIIDLRAEKEIED